MKVTLRHTVLSLVLAGSMATVSAVDFGGMLTNDSKFAGNDFGDLSLDQKNALSAWVRVPFNDKGTTYFTAEGLYQFEYKDIGVTADNTDAAYAGALDIDLFKFATTWEKDDAKLTLSVGRFFTTDVSGLVFSQTADGALLTYELPALNVSLYGAYTGILNARTVSILDDDFVEDTEKHYQRAEDYLIGAASIAFPNLFANQTISAQFLSTFKLQTAGYNRLYAELGIGGPLVSMLFYNLNTTFGFAKNYNTDDVYSVTNLTKLALVYYVPYKDLAVGLSGVYASGDNGGLDPFVGFTSQTATNALSGRTEYTGLFKTGLTASIKPLKNVLVGANGDLIFDAEDSIAYEGFQYGLNANWQILSDVSVGAVWYQYFDSDDSDRNKTCIQLKAAISF